MRNPYKRTKRNGRPIDEHRAIMEAHLGRKLTRFELVHHINGNKRDNRLENLKVVSPKEHSQEHEQQKHPLTWVCEVCGSTFTPPATKRGGLKRTCSKKCRYALVSRTLRQPTAPNSMYRDGAFPSQAKNRKE